MIEVNIVKERTEDERPSVKWAMNSSTEQATKHKLAQIESGIPQRLGRRLRKVME